MKVERLCGWHGFALSCRHATLGPWLIRWSRA